MDYGGELGSMGCALGIDKSDFWTLQMVRAHGDLHCYKALSLSDVAENLIYDELGGGETIIMAILQDSIDTVQM